LGSEKDSISTLNRQQQTVGTFSGNNYNAGYAGLNYYLYGMKLRLMVGEEYANLTGGTGPKANYSGWTTWVGFRLYF
jgi:phosphate-selective porin OprO/OprP